MKSHTRARRIETRSTGRPEPKPAEILRGETPLSPLTLEERIRARAYEIYQARRGGPGDAISDWLQAERELRASGQIPASEVEPRRITPASVIEVRPRGDVLLAGDE